MTRVEKQETPDMEPTPVEEELVRAIREHRSEWPYIYSAMKSVTKDDLLNDAEYCKRHKHPSMTNFYTECGKIAGMHISVLRKYERAGRFYCGCAEDVDDLPLLTDERVINLSPDDLVLADRICRCAQVAESSHPRALKKLSSDLVKALLKGSGGLTRTLLKYHLERLEPVSEAHSDNLWHSIEDLRHDVCQLLGGSADNSYIREMSSAEDQKRFFKDRVGALLSKGGWLKDIPLGAGHDDDRFDFMEIAPVRGKEARYAYALDFVAFKSSGGDVVTHGFLVSTSISLDDMEAFDRASVMSGADYYWIVSGEIKKNGGEDASAHDFEKEDHEDLTAPWRAGLMEVRGDELIILKYPAPCEPFVEQKAHLHETLLVHSMRCAPKLKDVLAARTSGNKGASFTIYQTWVINK